MKYISRLLVASSLLLGISGCATGGPQPIASTASADVSTRIIKGKTTQAEVRQIYGGPAKSSFTASGNEIWEYEAPSTDTASSGGSEKKTLVFFFNKQKIVQQYAAPDAKPGGVSR